MMFNRDFVHRLGSSRFNYWFGYVANSLLVAWLVGHAVTGHGLLVRPSAFVGDAVAGLLAWSLAEYVLHRYVYHAWPSFLSVGHDLHHKHPKELIGVPWYLTTIVLVALFELIAHFASPATTGIVMGFAWLGYILYCVAHHGSHHWRARNGWLRWTKRNHQLHHAYAEYNYAFTTPLWDIVFGTQLPERLKPARVGATPH